MSRLLDDPDGIHIVVEQLIRRAHLEELVGPLAPSGRSIGDLLLLDEGEEAEVDLIGEDGSPVATILVDLQDDPVNGWRLGLRGWRLADDVASV